MERFQERVPWRDLCSNIYPLEKAGEALNDIEEQRVAKAILRPSARGS